MAQKEGYDPYGVQYAEPIPQGYKATTANMTSFQSPKVEKMDSGPAGDISWLAGKRRFYIKQRFEMLESIANTLGLDIIEFSNKYDFFDADTGEPMLFAAEKSNPFCRCCCKPNHPATLHVFDVRPGVGQVPLFTMEKPFTCNLCTLNSFCAQSQITKVTATSETAGSATKHIPCGGNFTPIIDIHDKLGNLMYTLKGPCFILGGLIELMSDQEFKMFDTSGLQVGRIVKMKPKEGMQIMQEAVGDADRFLFEFDSNLDAEKTANLLGTLLLLDYMFFESGPPCQFVNGKLQYNCCDMYCFGFLFPCKGECGGQGGNMNA